MGNSGSLPPHLAEFVREQLASGHFRSEGEVIRTALGLLEGQVHSPDDLGEWLKQEIERGVSSKPSAPATKEFWDRLRERVRTAGSGHGD
jgi:putative addiction module CopG family antidote